MAGGGRRSRGSRGTARVPGTGQGSGVNKRRANRSGGGGIARATPSDSAAGESIREEAAASPVPADTACDVTGERDAACRIALGVSDRSALTTSACARSQEDRSPQTRPSDGNGTPEQRGESLRRTPPRQPQQA